MSLGRHTLRRLAVASATAVGAALLIGLPASPAAAHGGLTYPATRTYACYVNGVENGAGGGLNPTNAACKNLLAENGNYPFYNWFGNLLSNAAGQHRTVVPDGNLCGPLATFSGARAARTDWPTTTLQAGSKITMQYNAWARHPGTWSQYVTKDGWNPNSPLKWSDLEAAPFNEVTNPPLREGGPQGAEYYWDATLPNKSGRHIIYSIWTRSDSPEAFYNCADVVFQGGTVNPNPDPDPTTPPPTTPPPVTPPPTTPPVTPAGACSVKFDTSNAWNTGFTGQVTVSNNGDSAVNAWELRWTFTNGEKLTQAWSSTATQTGAAVSVKGAAWNGSIPARGTAQFGFNGTGAPKAPSGVTLNGASCTLT
jgi:predicted carbohydrate-binding protein with CBM5 and CBM33 domain